MKRLKQIFGLRRYFILVYMYQLEDDLTGQGQCTVTVNGGKYFSLDVVSKNLTVGGEIKNLLLLNVVELNKRDYIDYVKGSEMSTKNVNEKL